MGPDSDRAFYSDQLGILTNDLDRAHLAMAYRILTGEPLNAKQVDDVSGLAGYRQFDPTEALNAWLESRKTVPGAASIRDPIPTRQSDFFVQSINCGSDAFTNASATLVKRMAKPGQQAPK